MEKKYWKSQGKVREFCQLGKVGTLSTCPGTPPPPPREQNDRQVQKYYLAPNFVCGR